MYLWQHLTEFVFPEFHFISFQVSREVVEFFLAMNITGVWIGKKSGIFDVDNDEKHVDNSFDSIRIRTFCFLEFTKKHLL